MVRPICKDIMILKKKSVAATAADKQVAEDLMDTLVEHHHECVGMAANMIGVNKRIIIAHLGFFNLVMINPVIVEKSEPYETEESCLSLIGQRKTTRYNKIKVEFEDTNFEHKSMELEGFNAQIVQHECDHLEGIII